MGLWPLIPALIVTGLNVDFVVIPTFKTLDLSDYAILGIAGMISSCELLFWYWFWGWFIRTIIKTKKVQEHIDFGREIGTDLKREGYIGRVVDRFIQSFYWATNPKHWGVRMIKAGGWFSIFCLAAIPEPFLRTMGLISCRLLNSTNGLLALMMGNLLHLVFVIGGWNLLFSFFE